MQPKHHFCQQRRKDFIGFESIISLAFYNDYCLLRIKVATYAIANFWSPRTIAQDQSVV